MVVTGVIALVVMRVGAWILVPSETVQQWDRGLVREAVTFSLGHEQLVEVLLLWEAVTEPWVLHVLLYAVCLTLFLRGWRRARVMWAVSTGLAGASLGYLAKQAVERARPELPDPVTSAVGLSYPSGHATNAALVTTLALVLLWPLLSRGWRYLGVVLAVLLVALTCLDRVFLGVHYPSDVIAGVVMGCAMTAGSYAVWHHHS